MNDYFQLLGYIMLFSVLAIIVAILTIAILIVYFFGLQTLIFINVFLAVATVILLYWLIKTENF